MLAWLPRSTSNRTSSPGGPPQHAGRPDAPGFTLVEVLVVLVVMVLAIGLTAPAWLPDAPANEGAWRVLDSARREAVRRAAPLVLTIETDGSWRLAQAADTSSPLAGGELNEPPPVRVSVRLTPLGACLPVDARSAGIVDAVRCRLMPPP